MRCNDNHLRAISLDIPQPSITEFSLEISYYTHPPATKLGGVYWIHPVCPSVCLSVNLSCPPVASTVQDGFFPYLVQMINSMRGCVAYDDLWPRPISSRSFGLDLENRVRSVASTVLDGLFLYLAQMITIIRGCVACYVFFRIWKLKFLANFKKISALTFKKKSTVLDGFFSYLAQMITGMRGCVAYNDLWPWPISSRSFGLGLENRVRSVASTVLDGFFPYLVQIITSMRRCVACDDLWPWPISSRSFGLDLENRIRSVASTVLDGFFLYMAQMIMLYRDLKMIFPIHVFPQSWTQISWLTQILNLKNLKRSSLPISISIFPKKLSKSTSIDINYLNGSPLE